MLETYAVATSTKPSKPSASPAPLMAPSLDDLLTFDPVGRGDIRHAAAYRLAITASNALPITATDGFNPVNNSMASAA